MTQLILTLDDNGKLQLQGPIANKIFCYGLMELAKEAIVEHHKQQATRVIEPTPADVSALLKN